ncbi:hypothetical protein C8F04DRAFT_1196737 [Mycena alexandri]|uniref:Uncharacterized protein n=1 Tax=Mycena alexandri TaxID=1745969 RepID=A0AAD6S4I0_9AGAR|nr:hypothetical protein C8F04DRAFT_1196737 [Mycena alexandri]
MTSTSTSSSISSHTRRADELARPMYNDELVGYDPSGTTSQPPGRSRTAYSLLRLRAIQYDPAPATTTPHALDRPYPAGCANERAPPRVGRLWAWRRDTRARVRLLVDAEVVDDDDEEEAAAAAAAWGWSEEEVGAAGDNDAQRMTGAGASEEAPPKRGVVSEVMDDDDEPCILAPSKGVYARRRGGGVCGRDDGVQQRRVHSGGAAKTKGPTHLDNKLVRATYNAELVVYDASGTTPPPARSCTAYPLLPIQNDPTPLPHALHRPHPARRPNKQAPPPVGRFWARRRDSRAREAFACVRRLSSPMGRTTTKLHGDGGMEEEGAAGDNDARAAGASEERRQSADIRELRNEVVLRGGWGWVFWVKKDVSASETYGKRYERKRLCRGVLD